MAQGTQLACPTETMQRERRGGGDRQQGLGEEDREGGLHHRELAAGRAAPEHGGAGDGGGSRAQDRAKGDGHTRARRTSWEERGG